MATTYPLIRDQHIAQIRAITPALRSDRPFRVHRDEDEFADWCKENAKACWRRFEMLSNTDHELHGMTNAGGTGTLWQVEQTLTLMVAYPRMYGKFGADNERDLDDAIDSDLAQIDKAIGPDGNGSWVSGLDVCERIGVQATKTDEVVFVASTYRLLYDRSY